MGRAEGDEAAGVVSVVGGGAGAGTDREGEWWGSEYRDEFVDIGGSRAASRCAGAVSECGGWCFERITGG